jgi:hypothetical protein
MKQVSLKIIPEDTNYEVETRTYGSREIAQGAVNGLYMTRFISQKEWNRLTDELSPKDPIVTDPEVKADTGLILDPVN